MAASRQNSSDSEADISTELIHVREQARQTIDATLSVAGTADSVVMNVRMVAAMANQVAEGMSSVMAKASCTQKQADCAYSEVETAGVGIAELIQKSDQINSVVRLIAEIASQTKLLSLNASIEAVHAGAAGSGFGVVAAEVKELAKRTFLATAQIEEQIRQVVDACTAASATLNRTKACFQSIQTLIEEMAAGTSEQGEAAKTIRNFASEAATSVEEIGRRLGEIAEISQTVNE